MAEAIVAPQPLRRRLLRGGPVMAAALAALGTLGGCSLLVPPTLPRMDTLRLPGPCPGRSDTLVVMLPGVYSRPPEFVEAGFPQALRERGIPADVLIVDSHLGYYEDRSVLRRLREEVILPARAEGYQRVWLVGISLGGLGALGYAVRHRAEIDGLLVLAPYLGPRSLTQEIEAAGGAAAWRTAGSGRGWTDGELDREIWSAWAGPAAALPALHLGYGLDDRFASAHRLFAGLLPAARVDTVPGGHDWPVWRALWLRWLARGPLAMAGCLPPGPA